VLCIGSCRKEHRASDRDAPHIRADFEFHICPFLASHSFDTDRSNHCATTSYRGDAIGASAHQALLNEAGKGGILGSVNRIEEEKILCHQNGESCGYYGARVLERLKMAGLNKDIDCKRSLFIAGGTPVNGLSFTYAYSKIV